MRGFMCDPQAATAVCMTGDHLSVIVPRRPDRSLVDQARFINHAKYTRFVEYGRFGSANNKRSTNIGVKSIKNDHDHGQKASQMPFSTSTDQVFQVVVMRVSLHCQGCAGKVKKHLSKMEGVTSFNIDLEMKRVTVMGHVSPIRVLESISKVKRAELLSS